jgi:hypothetical protein
MPSRFDESGAPHGAGMRSCVRTPRQQGERDGVGPQTAVNG